jgi:biopolymer transport protein ExbD
MAVQTTNGDDMITGINVTPLVDVVLVLLVVLMVTASYVVSRGIPVELPRGATAEAVPTTLAISIDKDGRTYLDAQAIADGDLRARIRTAFQADAETRAVIAADGRTSHARVVRVIDLLRQENVTKFALNVEPEALGH